MLRDLTKTDWLTMLAIPRDIVPQALLLWGTRNLKARYATMRQRLSGIFEIGAPNALLEDVFIGKLGSVCVGYASVYGDAMASEVVHLFGVLGARLVIQIGTCGGFGAGLKAGNLFVAEEAYCGDGASQYYKRNGKMVAATEVFAGASDSGCRGGSIARGKIYTTSALFAEGKADIDHWASLGFSAVDMETAATFSVAEHFGMDRGSILTVFDDPCGHEHILSTDDEKDARRSAAQTAMVEIALATIAKRIEKMDQKAAPANTVEPRY